jgi:hypothetical protein
MGFGFVSPLVPLFYEVPLVFVVVCGAVIVVIILFHYDFTTLETKIIIAL